SSFRKKKMKKRLCKEQCLELRGLLKLYASGLAVPRTLEALIPPVGQVYCSSEPVSSLNRLNDKLPLRSQSDKVVTRADKSRGVRKTSSQSSQDQRPLSERFSYL